MTTLEIYEHIPYDPNYHRYMCKWGKKVWFFTDEKSYSGLSDYLENVINDFSHLLHTIDIASKPRTVDDVLLVTYTHMPELLI